MTPQAKFNESFDKRHPGMSHDTVTYRDEWDRYLQGWLDGQNRMLEIMLMSNKDMIPALEENSRELEAIRGKRA